MFRRRRIFTCHRPFRSLGRLPAGSKCTPKWRARTTCLTRGSIPKLRRLSAASPRWPRRAAGRVPRSFTSRPAGLTSWPGRWRPGLPACAQAWKCWRLHGRWSELQRLGGTIVDLLNNGGYAEQAAAIGEWLSTSLIGKPIAAAVHSPAQQPLLPTRCPSCGAAVNSKELNWLDDLTAECLYCSGPIRAESK